MIIPNLIIPGAAKSGTSSLHEYLRIHPEIAMSSQKEPHFFTLKKKFDLGLDFYNSIFPEANDKHLYHGESSTSYLPNKDAIHKIKNTLGEVKFIIILRNPVKRAISHYKWLVTLGREKDSFRKAVLKNIKEGANYKKPEKGGIWKGYYTSSLYGKHLKYLYELYTKDNILVITTEDLANNPLSTLNKCFSFLKIRELDEVPEIRSNVTKEKNNKSTSLKHTIKKGLNSLKNNPKLFLKIPIIFNDKISQKFINKEKLITNVDESDELWILDYLKEDIILFKTFHPEILKKWKL